MTKTWWILALLAAVFGLVGAGLVVGGLVADGPLVVVVVGALFLLVGVALAVPVPAVRRQQNVGDEDALADVEPAVVPAEAPRPWTEEQVAGELARVFAEAPYVVQRTPGRIRVRVDLADARFLGPLGVRDVKQVYAHDLVVSGPGRAAAVDRTLAVEWSAGVDGALQPRIRGSAKTFSGQAWGTSFRKEYGVGANGRVGAQVDWSFDLKDVQQPVRDVLERAGWQRGWSAEGKVGLAFALLGGSAVVIVPLAFLVRWLAG